ncbi:NADH-ubiquinone oxidoreductase [Thermosipho melanesiensis]|uniref:NADH/Ubiquinone/plastoquinone (Complex I) n=2 Tax=Thermosipho melanesiensis TaxID=46541 RepID=A6LMB9_THEM4|nr:Na+/H+ antiporter subunit D [Thermosipho melanesiensis]ABR31070.1 NADH/Ubiquinone/plastoquinone (complex I) [Thermosipho melanesiensis BI429]APT74164.1 oxidoreductase [Thermosipho melanesiensis]OOC36110.1 NADH-ubiquinone oxidoreductase [Thermosipho melanesiensis]OOC36927.1 NADH-ubiquinone oxidoreductase [Thermosipho melanesiensis]OOC37678.1 NADH-ubiquinone oxidoreductase [Thermosipho melanesiensis]
MIALLVAIPLISAFLFVPFKDKSKYILPFVILLDLIVLFNLAPGTISEMGGWKAPFGIVLVLDSASFYTVLVVNIIFLLISFMPQIAERNYSIILLILLGALNGLILTGDIFNSFVFLEITAAAGYIIASTKKNYYGAFKYLIIGGIAGGFYLLGAIYAYLGTGSLNLADIAININHSIMPYVALLLFVGLAVEAKVLPLAGWVPSVYASGSSLTPTVLGTTVTFSVIYLLGRIFITVFNGYFLDVIYVFGLLTLILAEIAAFRQEKLLKALAFSSIAQAGLVLSVISLNTFSALNAAYFHLLNDVTAKLVLFIVAASVSGSFMKNKTLGITFSIASFSLIGFPLFAGFRSKLLILKSAFEKGDYLLPILLLIATVIEMAYLLKWNVKFWYSNEDINKEIPWNIMLLVLIVALFIIYIGIFPEIYLKISRSIAEGLINSEAYVTTILGGM